MKKLVISKNELLNNLNIIRAKIGIETNVIAVVKANRNGIRFDKIFRIFN